MRSLSLGAAMAALVTLAASPALAGNWKTVRSKKYGYSMQVPKGTVLAAKEWPGGWGGLWGAFWDSRFYGLAQRGKFHKRIAIEIFGVIVTGVPGKHWTLVDKGFNKKGFKWYRAVVARRGKRVALGVYGVGSKGSYLVVLTTNARTYAKHKRAFDRWYRSVSVF